MKIYKYFLLHNKKLKTWIKYWLYHKKAGGSGILSKILQGFSFNLANTLNRKFNLFEIEGNSTQDGTPSPDNEQPIDSAGDNGSINEKINNKNLWNLNSSYSSTGYTTILNQANFKLKKGNYILSFEKVTVTSSILFRFFNKDKSSYYDARVTPTFKTPILNALEDIYYVTLIFNEADSLEGIQLEPGTTETPYVPHEEQDYSIPVQQPMRSIGDVRDKFVKVNGNWYERHYIARKIFDGTEEWGQNGSTASTGQYVIASTDKKYGILNLLSNSFVTKQTSTENSIAGRDINRNIYITIDLSIVEFSVAKFKAYLAEKYASGKSVYVDYELEEPLDLPCTQAQIDILENLPKTYAGQTNVYSEDETPAYLNIQYYKEV